MDETPPTESPQMLLAAQAGLAKMRDVGLISPEQFEDMKTHLGKADPEG